MRDINATSLTKILDINAQELKRLRQKNGGLRFLNWLKYENTIGKIIPDHVIDWFCAENIMSEDLKFIRDRMSVVQIYNYLYTLEVEPNGTVRQKRTMYDRKTLISRTLQNSLPSGSKWLQNGFPRKI